MTRGCAKWRCFKLLKGSLCPLTALLGELWKRLALTRHGPSSGSSQLTEGWMKWNGNLCQDPVSPIYLTVSNQVHSFLWHHVSPPFPKRCSPHFKPADPKSTPAAAAANMGSLIRLGLRPDSSPLSTTGSQRPNTPLVHTVTPWTPRSPDIREFPNSTRIAHSAP